MSEYQYYEWQTLDRPLTPEERSVVNALSSHIDVTSTRAQVDYSWGNFKHDPIHVLVGFFDAFLYSSNWGERHLAFRFPTGLLDEAALQPYLWAESIELTRFADHVVLEIICNDEEGDEWIDDEESLSTLAPLRAALLAEDYRMLYLAWLMIATLAGEDEALEPPVPLGLGALTTSLSALIEFFGLDPFLVEAAAQSSETHTVEPAMALSTLIERLTRAECNDYLQRLASDEALLSLKLNRRLRELGGQTVAPAAAAPSRTLLQLKEAAAALDRADSERQRVEAAARRKQELQDFAAKAPHAWIEIDKMMEKKSGSAYDAAVALLVNLRDLAVMQNNLSAFTEQLARVQAQYSGRRAFMERLREEFG